LRRDNKRSLDLDVLPMLQKKTGKYVILFKGGFINEKNI